MLGHSEYKGVCAADILQRVSCETFLPLSPIESLDLVLNLPPGIDNVAFVLLPNTVLYARVLLLFSASATTDAGSKSFDGALVSTLKTYYDPEIMYYVD